MGKLNKEYHDDAITELDPKSFKFHASHATNHLEIKDCDGVTLAYRLRIPTSYTQILQQSESLIPVSKLKDHSRGKTINRHWALWRKYTPEPSYSSSYLKDKDMADKWFEMNSELFKFLSDVVLRNIDPRMYAKFKSISDTLPLHLKPLCGAWFGCAINQNQTTDGEPHIDKSDYHFGYNVVTGWGDFTSTLLLWQIEQSIEILPGDAVLFFGRLFTHNAVSITGCRNIIDCFSHDTVFTWHEKQKDERKKKKVEDDVNMENKALKEF
jgi:hypothetical protein